MPFDTRSLADARQLLVALGKALLPGLNFGSPQSYHGKWTTWYAGGQTQIEFHVDSAQRELHPLTAPDGKPINDWGSTVGVARKDQTPARKSAAGRVRGNAGATVLSGTQLRHPQSGLLFAIANATTITIPGVFGVDPDSFVDADIVGVDKGSLTRLKVDETLNFLTDPGGIESEVKLVKALDEDGFDNEQFGPYRGRVLRVFSETPTGGNQTDFVGWAEAALSTVRKAYAFPNRAGRGTIDIAAFYAGSGSARALTTQDRDAVLAYVKTKAPFHVAGAGGGLRVIATIADPQTVEIQITTTGVPAYAFDWPGSALVASYNATTRELQFAGGSLPSSLRAGHRLILVGVGGGSGVGAQDGAEFKIEAVTAIDKVILASPGPVTPPASPDIIYPGGPLVTPLRAAIVAHLNGEIVYAGRGLTPIPESAATDATGQSIIGLDTLAAPMGPANPAGIYGAWSGAIVLGTLFKICMYKAGVRNATIVSPVADYEPLDDPFPTSNQIHYVTPAVVIVRSA